MNHPAPIPGLLDSPALDAPVNCSGCRYCLMPRTPYPASLATCVLSHRPRLIDRNPDEATCSSGKPV